MNNVFLSVLIPTFNRPDNLRNCLNSLLSQDWQVSYEVIISEDNYDNESITRNILKEFPMMPIKFFIQKKNLGMFENWNFLIKEANGEYFTILNDDDILLPSWASVLSEINGKQMLGVLSIENSPKETIQKHQNDTKHVFKNISFKELYWGLWTNGTLGSIFHTKSCKGMDLFNPFLYPISDWDFYVRYIEKYGGKVSHKISALYGRDDSASLNKETMLKDMEKSYLFREEFITKQRLKNNLKLIFIKNLFYAKKYSICRSSIHNKTEHKFPNALLSFSPIRLLLRFFPMHLARFLLK